VVKPRLKVAMRRVAPSGPPTLEPLGPEIGDFADSAAIVDTLDLVIAVDTAVVHLAGALPGRCGPS
jgi:hypothetical protein